MQTPVTIDERKILSRRDYQEILAAKLAGGDLHAYETLQKLRRVDRMLDRLRIASGEKPLYGNAARQVNPAGMMKKDHVHDLIS